jgi:hypothetical protein
MASGEARSELRPALGKPSIMHENEVQASLMSVASETHAHQNMSLDELEMLRLDGRCDDDRCFG